jgi:hypothetical protein
VSNLKIIIRSVESAYQLGDQFTKVLGRDLFEQHLNALMGWLIALNDEYSVGRESKETSVKYTLFHLCMSVR